MELVYERAVAPLEQKAATKLRKLFSALGDQTYQLLREYQKYKDLVKRYIFFHYFDINFFSLVLLLAEN